MRPRMAGASAVRASSGPARRRQSHETAISLVRFTGGTDVERSNKALNAFGTARAGTCAIWVSHHTTKCITC